MKKCIRKIYSKLPKKLRIVAKKIYLLIFGNNNSQLNNSFNAAEVNLEESVKIQDYILEKKKNALTIDWVVPQPIIGSGGHRNIYRIIHYLAKKGYNVTIYIDPQDINNPENVKSGMKAQEKIKKYFFDLECSVVYGVDNIEKCDVLFATHFDSAYFVKANEKKAKLCCYFIQDYECYFNPMSYQYLRAYNTYKMGLFPITSGPWPLKLLQKNFGIKEGDYFRFPIDQKIYYYDSKIKKEKKIVFFAKPYMPRRCYQLGIEALEIVKKKHPEWEIVFYGSNSADYQNVPFEFVNLGLVDTIENLGNLYRTASIGVAFSTTNPSLVPYEMMACGTAVVDLDFNNSVVSYESKKNISLAEPTKESVAKTIIKLIENKEKMQQQVENALLFCKKFPSEQEMCEKIEKIILKQLKLKEKTRSKKK